MPWFRVDDGFHSHPKVLAVSLAARGMWVTCGSWSSAHLTDGFIRDQVLASLGGSPELAEELVTEGLWRRRRGGYQFHDWDKKNPTKEAVENDRKTAAERQRRYRSDTSARRKLHVKNDAEKAVDNSVDGSQDVRNRSSGNTSSRRDSRRDSRSDNGVSHTTPARRAGIPKNGIPAPSRSDGRASPPGSPDLAAKPRWCGKCDETTRMLGDDLPRRCPDCHPLTVVEAM